VLRKILIIALSVALMACAMVFAARQYLPPILTQWVAGPDFNRMMSTAVGHALKVDGKFGPMSLGPDLSVTTEGFTSTGWPGQAIGGLNTTRATGWFNPWGIFRGRWQIDRIDIAKADFGIVAPNDALKKADPVIPPKPWYAFVMPSEFHCGWIDCPDMTIDLPVGQSVARGKNIHLGATTIGRNFKYYGRGGVLEFDGYPHLAIDAMEVYVTREVIDIGYLYLREPNSPQSNLRIACRLGQHADKSTHADVEITSLNVAPFLPADIARILSGKLSGTLQYATDTSGGNATGGGSLRVDGGVLANWDYLDGLAAKANDPSLRRLDLERVSLDYSLTGDTFHVTGLEVSGREQIDLRGSGSWNMTTDTASVSLKFSRVPLRAYLPAKIGEGLSGELSGNVDWSWQGTHVIAGHGGGTLQLNSAVLRDFEFQKFISRFLKNRSYDDLVLQRASLRWAQDNKGLRIDQIDALAPDRAGLRGSVAIDSAGNLSGTVFAGLPESSLAWLPDATKTVFAEQKDGLFWAAVKISGTEKKPENNLTAQILAQLEKHPVALAELAVRGLSWWIGDEFGTDKVD
jgi:hypothetical protein